MKAGIALIFVMSLLLGCSGESTDKNTPQPVQKLSWPLKTLGMSL
jgi:hypothetical protein